VPDEPPSIEGPIQQVTAHERTRVILVEADPAVPGREPAASVTITRGTDVLVSRGASVQRTSPDELTTGTRVRVWFTGPVAESFPVQVAAGTVLILR
jgi:hypothetical protein